MHNSFPMFPDAFSAGKRQAALPADMPGYMVYMTREALRCMTGSLSGFYSGAETILYQTRQMLAYDRAMRTFAPWAMPGASPWFAGMPPNWFAGRPQQIGFVPSWTPAGMGPPFMGMTTMTTLGPAFPPYGAGAFYPATPATPAIWGFSQPFPRFF